jgi:Pyruvate/2-oxoacid:ferredoxin oxidoreductase gamma subunit
MAECGQAINDIREVQKWIDGGRDLTVVQFDGKNQEVKKAIPQADVVVCLDKHLVDPKQSKSLL